MSYYGEMSKERLEELLIHSDFELFALELELKDAIEERDNLFSSLQNLRGVVEDYVYQTDDPRDPKPTTRDLQHAAFTAAKLCNAFTEAHGDDSEEKNPQYLRKEHPMSDKDLIEHPKLWPPCAVCGEPNTPRHNKLETALEAAQADARRYRWVRMRPTMRGDKTPEELDAAIDAALAGDKV